MCSDKCSDDDWLIRRYNSTTSYDTGHLMNSDIIGLFHIITNKPALYSHTVLLGDGSQEVSCYGDGSEKNNQVQIFNINVIIYYMKFLQLSYNNIYSGALN
jgi:dolichyl-phosphate-mannose--protein O-mannosyl transferase